MSASREEHEHPDHRNDEVIVRVQGGEDVLSVRAKQRRQTEAVREEAAKPLHEARPTAEDALQADCLRIGDVIALGLLAGRVLPPESQEADQHHTQPTGHQYEPGKVESCLWGQFPDDDRRLPSPVLGRQGPYGIDDEGKTQKEQLLASAPNIVRNVSGLELPVNIHEEAAEACALLRLLEQVDQPGVESRKLWLDGALCSREGDTFLRACAGAWVQVLDQGCDGILFDVIGADTPRHRTTREEVSSPCQVGAEVFERDPADSTRHLLHYLLGRLTVGKHIRKRSIAREHQAQLVHRNVVVTIQVKQPESIADLLVRGPLLQLHRTGQELRDGDPAVPIEVQDGHQGTRVLLDAEAGEALAQLLRR
mmetsp:Transcript_59424/g.164293  ORF Transcript_59424/g.164293 Transcript_59424/m.164293 type:complete len:366 (+) Transcript_59424:975-2072(+)